MVIEHHGVALGSRDQQRHRIFWLNPACRQQCGHAVTKPDQGLARFVAASVAIRDRSDVGRNRFNVAHDPHEHVERVRARIGEAPQGTPLRIDRPLILFVEYPLEQTIVRERTLQANNSAESALVDQLLDEDVLGNGAKMIPDREQDPRLLHDIGNFHCIFGANADRLLDEHVLQENRSCGGRRTGVKALAHVSLQHGLARLLDLEEKGSVLAAHQQDYGAESAHAADTNHLDGDVLELITVKKYTPIVRQAIPVAGEGTLRPPDEPLRGAMQALAE